MAATAHERVKKVYSAKKLCGFREKQSGNLFVLFNVSEENVFRSPNNVKYKPGGRFGAYWCVSGHQGRKFIGYLDHIRISRNGTIFGRKLKSFEL